MAKRKTTRKKGRPKKSRKTTPFKISFFVLVFIDLDVVVRSGDDVSLPGALAHGFGVEVFFNPHLVDGNFSTVFCFHKGMVVGIREKLFGVSASQVLELFLDKLSDCRIHDHLFALDVFFR